MQTVRQAVEASELISASTSIPCSPSSSLPFHALPPDVQARPHCRVDRILGHDRDDLHLGLCDR